MEHVPAQRAAEHVEWLAALCQVQGDGEPLSANPHLVTLLSVASRLPAHPAFELLNRLRRVHSRDRMVKQVVNDAYGAPAARGELWRALDSLVARGEDLLGRGPHAVVHQALGDVRRRAAELAGELDPAADLADVTGEHVPLRVVLAPSVFLPPPQAGRHGVLVRHQGEWIAHLHFGFPLQQPPANYSIGRPWLLGGAWHYAVHLYLERDWPEIARRIAVEHEELAVAVTAAMAARGQHEARPFEELLRSHVNVAFKCLLSRRLGVPDAVQRLFARARGLVLFPWFEEWLLTSGVEGSALAAHIRALPDALHGVQSRWEHLARTGGGVPPTINLALVSTSARQASLVVPDEWPDGAVSAAVAGWRLLPLPVRRYSEWMRTRTDEPRPVIALGEPERNPLVHRVLQQRGLDLAAIRASDPAIIALSAAGFEEAAWCLAVAARYPETLAALRMEMALKQTHAYVIYDRGNVVDVGRIALDDVTQAGPA